MQWPPKLIKAHSLDVGPLSHLANGTLGINGFGGVFSQPLGYIITRVQVEGVWGYDEDQVALVIPDSTIFGPWVPVILGTLTINQTINVIKREWNQSVVCFLEWIEDSPVVGMPSSRTFSSEQSCCKPNSGSEWFEWSSQNDKEGGDRCFLIQNHTQPNKNHVPRKEHACNDSVLKGVMDPTCLMAWVWWTHTLKWLPGVNVLQ